MRSLFMAGSYELDQYPKHWVTDEQKLHSVPGAEIPSVRLPGRDGELNLPVTRTTGAAEWTLHMTVTGRNYAEFMVNKATLETALSPGRANVSIAEMQRGADGSFVRTLRASAMLMSASVEAPWKSSEHGAEIVYTFRIPSGVWIEPSVSVSVNGSKVYPALAGGSAPAYPTTINATGPFRLSSLDDPGAWLAYTGGAATIDVTRLTAKTSGGVNTSGLLDQGPRAFFVSPYGDLNHTGSALTMFCSRSWY